jgi:cysteine synthase
MPDDAAAEKAALLEALGAAVRRLRPVSIAHPEHFVNVARRVGLGKALADTKIAPSAPWGHLV